MLPIKSLVRGYKEKFISKFNYPMPSPQIKILLILAGISIIYAFVCEIRLSQKASQLAEWVRKERPDLWSELNFVARNWNGGHPGLKMLHRRKVVGLPRFDQEYEQLHAMEQKFLCGLGVGVICIGLLLTGFRFFGWHW